MDTAEISDAIQTARAQWEAVLAQVSEERMPEPALPGGWSVKDVIAHIAWFEREIVGVLQARALVGSELWELPPDERNAALFELHRHRPLDDVLAEARRVFQQLLQSVADLTDEELTDPQRFQFMPADWLPWQIIAGNSYEHYQHHLQDVRTWLDREGRHLDDNS